ncbi:MAG: putative tRNA sulfurtransferase [Candidatus Tectimicrobiota bacterium]|nr:MAG: putative tRNA sulfurtransferase [Candidatus Tectomicrobia bacterium]
MSAEREQYAVLHYAEASLKGKNRPLFVRRLMHNIRQALADLGEAELRPLAGRLLLRLPASVPWETVAERLGWVCGLANFARCTPAPHDLEAIKRALDALLAGRQFASFRVQARRAFKELPFSSQELNRELGAHVLKTHATRVDLAHPELTIYVELVPRLALLYLEKHPGQGGLPVGSSGRLLSLLSGGLDSPVAAYRMLKRGCNVDFVHFHSYPYLDRTSQDKARQLAQLLTRYQYAARLFLVPFGEVQQHIVSAVPPPYRVVVYRRYMVRIAEALAQQTGALALVTGESLGQVASQTLHNLRTIEAAATLPILRPLIGMDKAEIIQQAQAIGTYAISVLPDQDCCTLFVPRAPATRSELAAVEAVEKALDPAQLLALALGGVQEVALCFPPPRPEPA